MQEKRERGKFIVFEGGEGCGKGTQADLLRRWLIDKGYSVLPKEKSREPGGTPIGEEIRKLLLHSNFNINANTEAFLFYAARFQLLNEVIKPSLESGIQIVLDRYFYSTEVYQGISGANQELLLELRSLVTKPDLTFIIDTSSELGLEFAGKRGSLDRMERRGLEYHTKVNEKFREYSSEDNCILMPFICYLDDIDKGISEMHEKIVREVEERLYL